MIDKELLKDDELKYRLSLRSKNKPASCFDWHNALMADGVPILQDKKQLILTLTLEFLITTFK